MRQVLIALTLILAGTAYAQKDYQKILRTNPYLSNGYFIVDSVEWKQMAVDHINVEIIVATPRVNESTSTETIQSFTIENGFFGKADLGFLSAMEVDQFAYYQLQAFDQQGNVVVDINPQGLGEPGPIFAPRCRQTCIAASHAWSLTGYYSIELGQGFVELRPANTEEGSYYYFYVSYNDWGQFKSQYDTQDFNIDYSDWDEAFLYGASEVIYSPVVTAGMRDVEGYALPLDGQGAFGVAKFLGPWDW